MAEGEWFHCPWGECWDGLPIATKELLPTVLACALRGPGWESSRVLVHCDNMAVVYILKSHTSTDPVIMHLLRCLHFLVAYYDTSLRAVHVAGVANVAANALSRNLLLEFFCQEPRASREPVHVQRSLWDLMVVRWPDWLSADWRELLKTSLAPALWTVQPGPMARPNVSSSNSVDP